MNRALVSALLLWALGGAACVDAVQSGLPPLVQGCHQDSDCPSPFLCNDGGSCEEWLCNSSCDCPSPKSFGCLDGGIADGQTAGPTFSYCARGVAPTFPDAGC